jgi:hypothetical protein
MIGWILDGIFSWFADAILGVLNAIIARDHEGAAGDPVRDGAAAGPDVGRPKTAARRRGELVNQLQRQPGHRRWCR